MTLIESMKTTYKDKLLCLNGRASRSEYWYYTLGTILAYLLIFIIGVIPSFFVEEPSTALAYIPVVLCLLFSIPVMISSFTVSVRRLHDLNRPTWWILFAVIASFTGILALLWLIYMAFPGTKGPNNFGPDPVNN